MMISTSLNKTHCISGSLLCGRAAPEDGGVMAGYVIAAPPSLGEEPAERRCSEGIPFGNSERGEVLLRGVLTIRYLVHLGESSACQVPICTVAAHVLAIQPRK